MEISTTLQDQFANAIDTALGAGAEVRWYDSGLTNELAFSTMSTPPFGSSSSGVITMDTTPAVEDTSPGIAGTCVRLGLYATTGATASAYVVLLGVATSGTPDVTMSNNVIATTDTVQLSSLTITVPTGAPDVT